MSADFKIIATGIAFLVLFFFLCGCVSMSVGEVSYSGEGLSVRIYNPGEPADVFVQVTIYQVKGLLQQEENVTMTPVKLESGNNTILIPGTFKPGAYKLYMYVFRNGDRETAVIRDIVV